MIDLHAHSLFSDGQHSPAELVQKAVEAGVVALAVTDHDTVAGLGEAEAAARKAGIELVSGIELSAFLEDRREIHILGHFVDRHEPRLNSLASFLVAERENRMRAMVARLETLGLTCPFEAVVEISGGKNLGRPHLARVMAQRGYVKDVKDAFERYLAVGKPAFVERYKLPAAEAIDLIRRAGGTATVAHPAVNALTRQDIVMLKESGLVGIEVDHPDHPRAVRSELRGLARELDLVPTAGSDYHGELVVPGRRLGMANMDSGSFARLRERAARTERSADVV